MDTSIRLLCATVLMAGALAAETRGGVAQTTQVPSEIVGMWVTADKHIRLELLPNGRYDEARGTRQSVYKGRYTVNGPTLYFVDDSGFTATGTIVDGVLSAGPDRFRKE